MWNAFSRYIHFNAIPTIGYRSLRQYSTGKQEHYLRLTPQLENRLNQISEHCSTLDAKLGTYDATRSSQQLAAWNKELAALKPSADSFTRLLKVRKELESLQQLVNGPDPEFKILAQEEIAALKIEARQLETTALLSLLPPPEEDERNALLEIRGGAGGEEAALFAGELAKMYTAAALKKGWDVEILESDKMDSGALRSAVLGVRGAGVYGTLRHESGVHRVQRVPVTERAGRVQTSTAAVIVLPEPEETEIVINDYDIQFEACRASGAGGQHVNVTDSAVRLTHVPSGIVTTCQESRSQHQNRATALRMLRAKLMQQAAEARETTMRENRAATGIKTAERNERIRTYNYAQNRVTDHRCNVTDHDLQAVMAGERLDVFVSAMALQEQSERLRVELGIKEGE